jgi:hypothetical protein
MCCGPLSKAALLAVQGGPQLYVLLTSACLSLEARLMPFLLPCAQVEGGFVQGMGWLVLEELMWGDK